MGNLYSKFHDREDVVVTDVTLFLPIFGTPNHVESLTLSSTIPYPDDPLFCSFTLSPWFEQVANKLSNEEFYEKYKSTPRYQDNYQPTKQFRWNPNLNVYVPIVGDTYEEVPHHLPSSNGTTQYQYLIQFSPNLPWGLTRDPANEPEGSHFRPKILEFDILQYPTVITSDPSSSTTKNAKDSASSNFENSPLPSHVPFLKIGLPLFHGLAPSNTVRVWSDDIYPREYRADIESDKTKVLPFKGLGLRQEYSAPIYKFDNTIREKTPYTTPFGGGDGIIRTESQIYSQYTYPCKSVITIRGLDGYSFDSITHLPHIDTIPAHHLGTILILDMISDDSLLVLSQFITQTLSFLQRGCILPLINVDLWVLQINGDKLDNIVMNNNFIYEKLTQIGFNLDNIHLCPYEISPHYALPPDKIHRGIPLNTRAPVTFYPLLSKQSLTHFSSPIWDSAYQKIFQLHKQGHWDRLANRSLKKNSGIKFIPPHIFPAIGYSVHLPTISSKLLQKQFNEAIESYDPFYKNNHSDDEAVALALTFASFYRVFEIKARDYFGPLSIKTGKDGANGQKNNPNQQTTINTNNINTINNNNNINTLNNNNNNCNNNNTNPYNLQPAYELMFNCKEPSWDDPRTYFPHIKSVKQFISNPKPLTFLPEFDPNKLNNRRPLPIEYKAPLVKQYEKMIETDESESESESSEGEESEDLGPQNRKIKRKLYPKFYTSASIWPTPPSDDSNPTDLTTQHRLTPPSTTETPPHQTGSLSHHSNNLSPSLPQQLRSFGLPQRYEFESFIVWSAQVLFADQYNMSDCGYMYEPHVQVEIMKAVERINNEGIGHESNEDGKSGKSGQIGRDQKSLDFKKTLTSSASLTHSTSPITILESLLPISTLPPIPREKNKHPTPLHYLLLTISCFDRSNYAYTSPIFALMKTALLTFFQRLGKQVMSRILSRSVGNLHEEPPPPNPHQVNTNNRKTEQHIVPPMLRSKHYNTIAPLTYVQTRVEFDFIGSHDVDDDRCDNDCDGGDGTDHTVPVPDNSMARNLNNTEVNSKSDNNGNNLPKTIEIGLTYLHRGQKPSSVDNGSQSEHSLYDTHPLIQSVSFLPLAWLHGVVIFPFVSVSSRTKVMRRKFISEEDSIYLNRPIGEAPYDSMRTEVVYQSGCQTTSSSPILPSPSVLASPSTAAMSATANVFNPQSCPQLSATNNRTFGSFPPGFIPPVIPPLPSVVQYFWNHGSNQDQNNHAAKIVKNHRQNLNESQGKSSNANINSPNSQQDVGDNSFPFTIPFLYQSSNYQMNTLRSEYNPVTIDPCFAHYPSHFLASYHCPITFIILISNPIVPDPIPYCNIEVPWKKMGCDDLNPINSADMERHKLFCAVGLTTTFVTKTFFEDNPKEAMDTIPFTPEELETDGAVGDFGDSELQTTTELQTISTTTPIPNDDKPPKKKNKVYRNTKTSKLAIYKPPNKTTTKPSLIETLTQSQLRYYQENLPMLYKRQLIEQIFSGVAGFAGSSIEKLEKLWSVEVHTPQTLPEAMKRIESSAVERRLKLYMDLIKVLEAEEDEKQPRQSENYASES